MNGPKFGCGLSECGACTVLMDGQPIRSCSTAMSDAGWHEISTIEGLGAVDNPHPPQATFIAEQAAQCGYCLSGPMLYGNVFVEQNPNATAADISQAPDGPLCRSHTHVRMVRALLRYAQAVQS